MNNRNDGSGSHSGWRNTLRALKYRNYRLYFGGQSISLIGMWMQMIAMSWLVYRLTNSALLLGVVGFSAQIPVFFITPFAGVLADRIDKQKILIGTQISSMILALILAALVLTGKIEIWHIIFLSVLSGIVNAFDAPARQAFVVHMVEDKADLGNAIALNSTMFNGARLIGPSVAGLLIGMVGEGVCFLINGISYIAVIAALISMKITNRESQKTETNVFHEIKEGYSYAFSFMPIKAILIILTVISLAGMPYTVLMPVFAKNILHGGPQTLGFLMGASGLGALSGAIFLASKKSIKGLDAMIPIATTIFGAGLIAFSLSRSIPLAMLFLGIDGIGMIAQMTSCNTVLQAIVDDDKRGRVMSIYTMAFMGLAPFGSLLAGFSANHIGTPNTIMLGGVACIIGAAFFASKLPEIRRLVHPIYEKTGIIPESPTESEAIADLVISEEK